MSELWANLFSSVSVPVPIHFSSLSLFSFKMYSIYIIFTIFSFALTVLFCIVLPALRSESELLFSTDINTKNKPERTTKQLMLNVSYELSIGLKMNTLLSE